MSGGTDDLAVMARRGRSFRWAGRLLGARDLADAARLYALCRALDDLADEALDPAAARARLDAIADGLRGESAADPVVLGFRDLAARRNLPLDAAAALAATLAEDLGPVALPDERALLRYAHGAAGTVGLMMVAVLGSREPRRAAPFALDLGIAMQLTNVARDVAEDAAMGRLYLPATTLPSGISAAAIVAGEPRARGAAWNAVLAVLDLAAPRYRSAERGLRFLPPRAALAVLTAARLYEAIGTQIRRAGPGAYWQSRAVVPRAGRAALTIRALAAAPRLRRVPLDGAGHEPALHAALDGLPGANAAGSAA